jgi:putative transposase
MPRPKRADEADGIYHALNRGNARADVFRKPEDYEAFERIIAEGLERYPVSLFAYQLLPNHWHMVLRPNAPDYRQPSAPEAGQEGEESKTTSPDPLNLSPTGLNREETPLAIRNR